MLKIDKSNKLNADPEAGAGDMPADVAKQAVLDEKEANAIDAEWGKLVEKEKRRA